MKRNVIVKSVMALMFLLGVFSKGYAQGQDQNYQWIGNDVSSVTTMEMAPTLYKETWQLQTEIP